MLKYNPTTIKNHPEYSLLTFRSKLTREELRYCLKNAPETALAYAEELNLTRKQVIRCCRLAPRSALATGKINMLNIKLRKECIRREPAEALLQDSNRTWSGNFYLTKEEFAYCSLAEPSIALQYHSYHMSQRLFCRCALADPAAARKFAPGKMMMLESCIYNMEKSTWIF